MCQCQSAWLKYLQTSVMFTHLSFSTTKSAHRYPTIYRGRIIIRQYKDLDGRIGQIADGGKCPIVQNWSPLWSGTSEYLRAQDDDCLKKMLNIENWNVISKILLADIKLFLQKHQKLSRKCSIKTFKIENQNLIFETPSPHKIFSLQKQRTLFRSLKRSRLKIRI